MFLELACLLPQVHMHLLLVSPEVPHSWHRRSTVYASPDKTACGDPECSCAFAEQGIMKASHFRTIVQASRPLPIQVWQIVCMR